MVGTGIFTSLGFQVGAAALGLRDPLPVAGRRRLRALRRGILRGTRGRAARGPAGSIISSRASIIRPSAFSRAGSRPRSALPRPSPLAAMAFGKYFAQARSRHVAALRSRIGIVVLVDACPSAQRASSAGVFRTVATLFKIALIVVFIGAGTFFPRTCEPITFLPTAGDGALHHERAFRDQPRLRDVCLLGLECLDLHRRRNPRSRSAMCRSRSRSARVSSWCSTSR